MRKLMFFCLLCFCVPTTQATGAVVIAGWYGEKFEGSRMANGKPFRANDSSIAAHPTLPIGTKLVVINTANGKALTVIVKDRGPFIKGRTLDLSRAAAKKLGYIRKGTAMLAMSVVPKH